MAQIARALSPDEVGALASWLSAQPLPANTHAVPAGAQPLPLRCGAVP
jgi:cytochrome c553